MRDAFRSLLDELHRGRVFASPCDDIRKLHPTRPLECSRRCHSDNDLSVTSSSHLASILSSYTEVSLGHDTSVCSFTVLFGFLSRLKFENLSSGIKFEYRVS